MNAMIELKRDDMEIAARRYASNRASEITPTIVNAARTNADDSHVEGLLTALLKISVVEFTRKWVQELERRDKATIAAAAEILARTPNTTVLHRATKANLCCQKCSHVHEKSDHCGVSMGGAGACDCKAEVTA